VFARSSPRGKNRPLSRAFSGKRTRNVPRESSCLGRGDAAIPVEFSIPSDATSRITTIERFSALALHAQTFRVNFSDDFEFGFR